ncbi:MAG: methyltransferase domain-containing protein [Chitinivibrionales bacterium]|nr:methyltransferase domain-containing protein [Chitinivibrionales bacterium]MBD3396793.1 methyltransferase domain-containing protein [Chitinivibrionales bacterium]
MIRIYCMNCGATTLRPFIQLGDQPNGNRFVVPGEEDTEPQMSLLMLVCTSCWQVQIDHFPAPEFLFTHHPYVTGFNVPIVRHCAMLAQEIIDKLGLRPNSLVLDIGCNDGTLLREFAARGMRVLGIDPATTITEMARKNGITVMRTFWDQHAGQALRALKVPVDVITATAVFYHIPDLHDFVRGLAEVMDTNTVFVTQCIHLKDLLEKNQFDHFYHEHSCVHAIVPLNRLFEAHGMRLLHVDFFDVHGGSFVLYVARRDNPRPTTPSIEKAMQEERAAGLDKMETYEAFAARAARNAGKLKDLLVRLKGEGKRVYALGAPAKGSTLLNYAGIGPDLVECAVELNELKVGKLVPGVHIPVVHEAAVTEPPDYYLMLAWNFLDFFMDKYRNYLEGGGRFIVPGPDVRVHGLDDTAEKGA